jgi:DNA-binding XRE family transcriptional regulator
MNQAKREALEAAGIKVGDYGDFLGLTDAERQIIELRVRLARQIREGREKSGMTQETLATLIASTQPRVAKIEAAAKGVSLDQMWRAYFAVGGKADHLFSTRATEENQNPAKVAGLGRKKSVDV